MSVYSGLISDEEFDRIAESEGYTCACFEYACRWLRRWRYDHPDDDRDDFALILAVFPDGVEAAFTPDV